MAAVLPPSFAASVHTSYLQHTCCGRSGRLGPRRCGCSTCEQSLCEALCFLAPLACVVVTAAGGVSSQFLWPPKACHFLMPQGCGQNKLRLLPETVFVQKQSELGWIIYGPQHVGWLAGPRAGCWQVLLLGRMYGACESMYLGLHCNLLLLVWLAARLGFSGVNPWE